MLLDAALHYTSIAFTRGGAPAPALMSSPIVGGHLSAAAPRAAFRNESIEKGKEIGKRPDRLLHPGSPNERRPKQPSPRAAECPGAF